MTHETALTRKAERGCLVIADLSGYTDYLQTTELEHAEDVLSDLTQTVIDRLGPILTISKLEGDAVFAYALDGTVDASMLLDGIDDAYFAFRQRVINIAHATSCDCNACRLIPTINLKFVVHHGEFVRRRVAKTEELTGSDVVAVHRLLKNGILENLGIDAYAFFSDPVLEAMGVDPKTLRMTRHSEYYEDVGTLDGYVENLAARWEYQQERQRDFVGSNDAEFEIDDYVAAPPPVLWEMMTSPSKRMLWEGGVTAIDEYAAGGRRGEGTWNHCVHGKNATTIQEIKDWRPFRYFTRTGKFPIIGFWKWTVEFRPEGEGTRFHIRGEKLEGFRARLGWALIKGRFFRQGEGNIDRLRRVAAEEMEGRERGRRIVSAGPG